MIRSQITIVLSAFVCVATAHGATIGINIVLNQPVNPAILSILATQGTVLDVIPEINAVTLRAQDTMLPAIQALPFVAAANPDRVRSPNQQGQPDESPVLPLPAFSGGTSLWNLDAINVTDFGAGRTIGYDGEGVYIAVLDFGLGIDWREYFLEEQIDTVHARAFGGGGGSQGTASEQPNAWEQNPGGSGIRIISSILGFKYSGSLPLPTFIDGVSPKATIIPVKVLTNAGHSWSSVVTRGLLYVTELKTSGALGGAPLVVNLCFNSQVNQPSGPDPLEIAAIDYAIANGVVIVASAEDNGEAGMSFPATYAPVISVGNAGWVGNLPQDDPTFVEWILRDVPENDASQYFIFPNSGRQMPGQDLDIVAPGTVVAIAEGQVGLVEYTFRSTTRVACPHVAGIVALMLQKNPNLTPAEIEQILESTAMPMEPGCADISWVIVDPNPPGNQPTCGNLANVFFAPATFCWGGDATGAGLVQADAALAATPLP